MASHDPKLPPALDAAVEALHAHTTTCAECHDERIVTLCDEGKRLKRALHEAAREGG